MNAALPHPSPSEAHDSPWYRKAFGAGYLDLYAHRDESDAARGVEFVRGVLNPTRETRLLDLCCGPGRHLCRLAPILGFGVGIDLSRQLLSQARDSCQRMIERSQDGLPHRIHLVEGDMRNLPFPSGHFHAVVNLFTSFGYFEIEEKNRSVVAEVARVLRPGGAFILDHINRRHLETFLQPDSERMLIRGVRVAEQRRFDPVGRRICKTVRWSDPEAETIEWTESVRVYERDELAVMLESAGLRAAGFYGDYDRSAFAPDSPRMIVAAVRDLVE